MSPTANAPGLVCFFSDYGYTRRLRRHLSRGDQAHRARRAGDRRDARPRRTRRARRRPRAAQHPAVHAGPRRAPRRRRPGRRAGRGGRSPCAAPATGSSSAPTTASSRWPPTPTAASPTPTCSPTRSSGSRRSRRPSTGATSSPPWRRAWPPACRSTSSASPLEPAGLARLDVPAPGGDRGRHRRDRRPRRPLRQRRPQPLGRRARGRRPRRAARGRLRRRALLHARGAHVLERPPERHPRPHRQLRAGGPGGQLGFGRRGARRRDRRRVRCACARPSGCRSADGVAAARRVLRRSPAIRYSSPSRALPGAIFGIDRVSA